MLSSCCTVGSLPVSHFTTILLLLLLMLMVLLVVVVAHS